MGEIMSQEFKKALILPTGVNEVTIKKLKEKGMWGDFKEALQKPNGEWKKMLLLINEKPPVTVEKEPVLNMWEAKPNGNPNDYETPRAAAQTGPPHTVPEPPANWIIPNTNAETFANTFNIRELYAQGELPPALIDKYKHLLEK